jgi:hypothetical protein
MKTFQYSVIFLAILILVSCDDLPTQVDTNPHPLSIKILDEIRERPFKDHTVELYYVLIPEQSPYSQGDLIISPTPFFATTNFKFEVRNQSDIELKIRNLTTEESYVLLKKSLPAGGHMFYINFQDSIHYSGGLYKAYLSMNDIITDSTNLLYTKSKDMLYLSIDRDKYYINSSITDKEGKIDYSKVKFNLVGEVVRIYAQDGTMIGSYLISNGIKGAIFNKNMEVVKEFDTSVGILTDFGIVVKV